MQGATEGAGGRRTAGSRERGSSPHRGRQAWGGDRRKGQGGRVRGSAHNGADGRFKVPNKNLTTKPARGYNRTLEGKKETNLRQVKYDAKWRRKYQEFLKEGIDDTIVACLICYL